MGKAPPFKMHGLDSKLLSILKDIIPDLTINGPVEENAVISEIKVNLVLDVRIGESSKKLVCEVKEIGEPRHVFEAVSKLKYVTSKIENGYPLIMSIFLGEKSREICRMNGVGYVDLAGNCFLKFDGIFIDREGRQKPQRKQKVVKNIFAPLASRVIRVLLADAGRKRTAAELAERAGASSIYVFKILKKLEEKKYIGRDGEHRIILYKAATLLDEWADSYGFSENRVHTYYSPEPEPNKIIRKIAGVSKLMQYALTLHSGASLVAPYVRFNDIHFYVDIRDKDMWIKKLELRPVEFGGNVHLVEPYDAGVFYGIQEKEGAKIVSNVQLYIDLFKYPARGREQAEFLREQIIKY